MGRIAGGATEVTTGARYVWATASKSASVLMASDTESEFMEALSVGALCKDCDKLGIG